MDHPWKLVLLLMMGACRPKAVPTPAGTMLLDWRNTASSLPEGVGIAGPFGAAVHEQRLVQFTPNHEVRDASLKMAVIELQIDRQDVALTPNASGARPAPRAAVPIRVTAKLLDSGGWQFEPSRCDPISYPTDISEADRVGLFETCLLPMKGGREDIADVRVTIAGNGKHAAMAAFGDATLH